MKQPSRFRDRNTVAKERINGFVAIDNLTSQMPLLEVLSKKRITRIWVSYDLARVCGTYLEVRPNGEVVCITQYEHDTKVNVVRPSDAKPRKPNRLHPKPKSGPKNKGHKSAKAVHGRKKDARPKKQRRTARAAA